MVRMRFRCEVMVFQLTNWIISYHLLFRNGRTALKQRFSLDFRAVFAFWVSCNPVFCRKMTYPIILHFSWLPIALHLFAPVEKGRSAYFILLLKLPPGDFSITIIRQLPLKRCRGIFRRPSEPNTSRFGGCNSFRLPLPNVVPLIVGGE